MSSSSSSSSSSSDSSDGEEVWVENDGKFKKPSSAKSRRSHKEGTSTAPDDDTQIGPTLRNTSGLTHKDFGHALLPGEGAAMVSVLNFNRRVISILIFTFNTLLGCLYR